MTRVRVKLCGMQNLDSAKTALSLGVDYLGFIFAGGPRMVTPDQVRWILSSLPQGTPAVGVFMNQSASVVSEMAGLSGITHLQLHGDEDPAEFHHIGLPILKAVPVTPEGIVGSCKLKMADFALLDTRIAGHSGGTGKAFDWHNAKPHIPKVPFFVAGGLNPLNVRAAMEALTPYGVDVCSGVETQGEKNPELMARLMKEIRR